MPIPLILGGAALLGTGALGVGGARLLKDELDMGVDAAAREELNQGKGKGYNKGEINRGLFEQLRDFTMGNDREAIQERARELQVENINDTLGRRLSRTNQGLREIGASDRQIKPTYTDTVEDVRQELTEFDTKIPVVAAGQDANPDAGITIDTPIPQINRATRAGQRTEENLAYLESPIYQNQLRQQNLTNQLALGQMGLAEQRASNQMQIAMMNNQLERRRMDMKESRLDRKDRQAMIQQMMAGLSTLGASIAI